MTSLTSDELERELENGRIRPIYLFLGPEEYLIRQATELLKSKALAAGTFAFNYSEFSAKTAFPTEVLQAAATFPMMSPRRLVVATEADAFHASAHESLIAYLDQPSEKSVLVLVASEMDRRTSLFKRVQEKGCVVEFPVLKGFALERWAETYARKRRLRISSSSLKKIIELVGSDLQSLANEVDKLLLYAGGPQKEIPDSVIDDLVSSSRQHGIFELTGALGRRDRRNALLHLRNLLDSGEPPLVVVTMMARHFRQVLIAKELMSAGRNAGEIAAATQVPGWALDNFLRQARAIDQAAAERMYRRISEIDRRIKSSNVDERMVLERLICSL